MMSSLFYVTYTGVKVYPDDLYSLDITLEDIAHHLTKIQRFGGALSLDKSYSVAQHSILMALVALDWYNVDVARACLLHDATEAYLGDVVSPLKTVLDSYQELETKLHNLISEKYNINQEQAVKILVKELDTRILLDEARELVPMQYPVFCELYDKIKPLNIVIDGDLNPHKVKEKFLRLCKELNIED